MVKPIEEHFEDFKKVVAEALKDGITLSRIKDWSKQVCASESAKLKGEKSENKVGEEK